MDLKSIGLQARIGACALKLSPLEDEGAKPLKVVTNEKGEAVGDVLTIIC